MLHHASVTGAQRNATPEFVPRTAPLWALVDTVTDHLVLDAASRSRRARAWVRFGAVVAWFIAIILSGSPHWPLAVTWVVTAGLTVPHAYRSELKRWRTGWRSFDHFVGWLLPEYSIVPEPNPVGILDGVGCVFGGLLTGQFAVRAGVPLVFELDVPAQAIAASAAYALAAVVLIGGAGIVTTHFSWLDRNVAANLRYRLTWMLLTAGSTLLIFVLLWPGSPGHPGYPVLLTLDIGAALAAAFTCFYGRLGARRRIEETCRLVSQVKWRVREGDALHVHNVKHVAGDIANQVDRLGDQEGAGLVRKLAVELEALEEVMKNDTDLERKSAREIYQDRLPSGGADPSWTGVVADLHPTTMLPKDAEFIKLAVDALLSNAMAQHAADFELSLTAEPVIPVGSTIVLAGTCTCGAVFDGSALEEGTSLLRLAERLRRYRGNLTFEDHGDGRHTCRMILPTLARPAADTI